MDSQVRAPFPITRLPVISCTSHADRYCRELHIDQQSHEGTGVLGLQAALQISLRQLRSALAELLDHGGVPLSPRYSGGPQGLGHLHCHPFGPQLRHHPVRVQVGACWRVLDWITAAAMFTLQILQLITAEADG